MQASILIFERKTASGVDCATVGLGPDNCARFAHNPQKARAKLIDDIRAVLRKAEPSMLMRYETQRGAQLQRIRLQLTLKGQERRKVAGLYPVVIEPRWVSEQRRVSFAYHPERPGEIVPLRDDEPIEPQLRAYFQTTWSRLDDEAVAKLVSHGKERIDVLSFSFTPRSPSDDLPGAEGQRGAGDPAFRKQGKRRMKVLPDVAVDLSERAMRDALDAGTPREPFRTRLRSALVSPGAASIMVVGPPRSGKTTLLHRLVHDLLEHDGYSTHRDPRKVRHVWRVSGRRLIAGMSRVGDWEERCVTVVDDARQRVVLLVDDLNAFGRLGRSRQSHRSLADVFRGPVAQREIVLVSECTPEQWRQMGQDCPALQESLRPIHLPEADRLETFRLVVGTVREVERDHSVIVEPSALRAVVDLSESVLSHEALPGKALDMLEDLARGNPGQTDEPKLLSEKDVLRLVSRRTGVPATLLNANEPLDMGEVEHALAARVIGQPAAVRCCVDHVARVKSRLTDSRRPYGVLLFTGPTGVGKTELAKALAAVLYGSERRIARFDMGEYGGPDAASRLIGDRWRPDGALTRQVRQQPFSLVLLDEIEKAHPAVHALLLQLFEDGRLTDAAGRTASFRHTVVVMTSNLGARPRDPIGFGTSTDAWMLDIAAAVRAFFAPELFNRIDSIVPFRPLDRSTAVRIADKEISKLLRRRGLSDRNVFVQVSPAVTERLAQEAYSPLDGARAIKRHLDSKLGSLLTDVLSAGSRAAIRLLQVDVDRDGAFDVQSQSLQEAAALQAHWPLEPLLGQPQTVLTNHLASLREDVVALESSDALQRLSERIRHYLRQLNLGDPGGADAIYDLDAMRSALLELRDRVDKLMTSPATEEHEAWERRHFAWKHLILPYDGVRRIRLLETRVHDPSERQVTRRDLLACIGEIKALSRALARIDDLDQHAAVITLSDIGPKDPEAVGRLLELLAAGLASVRGTPDSWAVAGGKSIVTGVGAEGLANAVRSGVTDVVLRVFGIGVLEFFAPEQGTHVWVSRSGPQIVRVSVQAASAQDSPARLLDQLLRDRAAFRRAPAETKPINPDAMLPVARSITFDAPAPGGRAELTVEDYPTGFAATINAGQLSDAWEPVWLLRTAREDIGGVRP